MKDKIIFLDRDGTIIKDKHYLKNPKEIEFLPNTIDGLKELLEHDYKLVIVSNQSGVARGYFDIEDVVKVNDKLISMLEEKNIKIYDSLYCPHYKNGIIKEYSIDCNCRKPKTGMIDKYLKSEKMDKEESYMIGDKESDILMAINAGIKGIIINNNSKYTKVKVKNINEAANYIIGEKK